MHNIIVFGASITQGAYDDVGGGWVNRLATYTFRQAVESDFDDKPLVFNLGISGESIVGLKKRYKNEIEARVKNGQVVVIISIGVNDAQVTVEDNKTKTSPEDYKSILGNMIQDIKSMGHIPVFVGITRVDEAKVDPKPWDPARAYRNTNLDMFDQIMHGIALGEDFLYIPTADIFDARPDLLGDGLHPNAEGHQIMFERVREYLEKARII